MPEVSNKTPKTSKKRSRIVGNLVALIVGLCIASILLVVIDRTLLAIEKGRKPNRVYKGGERVSDDLLGCRDFRPNETYEGTAVINGESVWDVTYHTNEYGWRDVPQEVAADDTNANYLLFFGCSHTFGWGVEDDESFAAQTAARLPNHRVYNFSTPGYGPQQMLALAESGQLREQVKQPSGTAIYVFIYDHMPRVVGSMMKVSRWAGHWPYYVLDDSGEAVRRGNFDTDRKGLNRFYKLLSSSGTMQFSRLDLPLWYSDKDYTLVGALCTKTREILKNDLGLERFYVLIYPIDEKRRNIADQMYDKLIGMNVDVLDYRDLFDPEDLKYKFHEHDGHPTPAAHEAIAEQIARDLADE